jgi:hypothetical protein
MGELGREFLLLLYHPFKMYYTFIKTDYLQSSYIIQKTVYIHANTCNVALYLENKCYYLL